MKPLPKDTPIQIIVYSSQIHTLMMGHIGFYNAIRRQLHRIRHVKINRLIEAVITEGP